jgi:outer membrane scaffolding protein for murein synthesis (MipA/OmpV family)
MKISFSKTAGMAIGMSIICSSVFAQGNSSESQWSLGGGLITKQKVYRGIDRDNFVLPLLSYENKWVSIGVPKADLKLYEPNDSLSFVSVLVMMVTATTRRIRPFCLVWKNARAVFG